LFTGGILFASLNLYFYNNFVNSVIGCVCAIIGFFLIEYIYEKGGVKKKLLKNSEEEEWRKEFLNEAMKK